MFGSKKGEKDAGDRRKATASVSTEYTLDVGSSLLVVEFRENEVVMISVHGCVYIPLESVNRLFTLLGTAQEESETLKRAKAAALEAMEESK